MEETLLPSTFAWCCPKSAQSSQSWPICHPCNRICGPTIRTLKSWERIPMKTLRTLSRRTLYSRTLSGRTFSSGTFLQLGPRARHRCSQVTGAVKSSCWQTTPACLQQDLPPTGHSPSSTRRSEAVMLATAIRTLPGHSSSSPGSPWASPAGLSPKLASHWWVQSRRHYSELCPGRANRWCNLVASAVRHRVLLILRFEDRNCSS